MAGVCCDVSFVVVELHLEYSWMWILFVAVIFCVVGEESLVDTDKGGEGRFYTLISVSESSALGILDTDSSSESRFSSVVCTVDSMKSWCSDVRLGMLWVFSAGMMIEVSFVGSA